MLRDLARPLVAAWPQHAPAEQQAAFTALDLTLLHQPPLLYTAEQRAAARGPVVALVQALDAALRLPLPTLPAPRRAAIQRLLNWRVKVRADEIPTDAAGTEGGPSRTCRTSASRAR